MKRNTGRIARRPTPYPRRIVSISITSATTAVVTAITTTTTGGSVNSSSGSSFGSVLPDTNLDAPLTSSSSATRNSSPITITSGSTTAPFVATVFGPPQPSVTRRMMLTSDLVLLVRRVIHSEMRRYGCHYWPFAVVCVGTTMNPDAYEIRAPHPFRCHPTGRNSEFHTIDRQLVYHSLRMIAIRFGFGLTWFDH